MAQKDYVCNQRVFTRFVVGDPKYSGFVWPANQRKFVVLILDINNISRAFGTEEQALTFIDESIASGVLAPHLLYEIKEVYAGKITTQMIDKKEVLDD